MKSNKGFSLVELIVVIAIMAIIAAVAIPVYSGYITKAKEGVAKSEILEAVHKAELDAIIEANGQEATTYTHYTIAADGTVTVYVSADATQGVELEDVDGSALGTVATKSLLSDLHA